MIFAFEGLSFAGKTTQIPKVKKELVSRGYNVVVFKGPGQITIPGEGQWEEYNQHMHAVLHRLNELNEDTIIIGDRIFTEQVTGKQSADMLRRYKCHEDAKIVFFKAEYETLEERGNLDVSPKKFEQQYNDELLNVFDHIVINTEEQEIKETTEEVADYIEQAFEGDE